MLENYHYAVVKKKMAMLDPNTAQAMHAECLQTNELEANEEIQEDVQDNIKGPSGWGVMIEKQ